MTQTPFDILRADIKTLLESEKRSVTMEIRIYPQPIAGCDAQIPALWERRDAVIAALIALESLGGDCTEDELTEFIGSCSVLTTEQKQKFFSQANGQKLRSAAE
jgi:hypothetical protein